ncbi:NUDIX hydrolase [Acetivibrio saccincola]|jgi:hypothetical protein|uniref:NUDIX hydrolase n=1 Tax=Acetivibrio saccincola TaxID=1677857 RepID=A0A2K9E517_9FIRM|nr:NUDIX hydrolase [Acetivibrio saccincola]AUG58802.1 hypothetical protein HVS_14755 [Acetivibrio saccincola]NLW26973.1 NUDIX hydrolase [Acetivibrio saccincola]PQQ66099.1 hypothetical protein B9R14_04510 [Acetivibrio saccincola]HOA97772.1 NUDIX hydrolase [Acetivibrio saccincola]HQD28949.1 NUDIX hydrolase [Acetivibrio saccincola]
MIVRNYAGGVVFSGDRVLLSKGEGGKWMLPRSKISKGQLSNEVVKKKMEESGILAEFVSTAGYTNYEYSSNPRQKPFCDKITWYIMKAQKQNDNFYKIDEAMKLIEENQEKSLINLSFKKYIGEESIFNSL